MTNLYDNQRSDLCLNFLKELDELQKKYNVSLTHEDHHGGFIIEHGYGNSWVEYASEEVEKEK